jgi:hypothetical protein
MKSLAAWSALVLALASTLSGAPTPTPAPTKLKAHGMTVNGRISRIEPVRRSLSVRDAAGKETPLSWTAATRIAGGELKAGGAVTVRYLDKDSKHIATYIQINDGRPPAPSSSPLPVAQTPTPLTRGL